MIIIVFTLKKIVPFFLYLLPRANRRTIIDKICSKVYRNFGADFAQGLIVFCLIAGYILYRRIEFVACSRSKILLMRSA